ncbi:MAG: hypothetical protein ACD_79C01062G0002 [uncultured bacterium]|nr:MAG: hypothetical protein ACD_79C01062G0002 [uncultured bacterium]
MSYLNKYRPDLILFVLATALIGVGDSVVNSTLNNFLSEKFVMSSMERAFLEFPRELPGLLVVFISAALFFLRSRRLAVFASLLGSLGLVLIAFFSTSIKTLYIWMFILSAGQHIIMPIGSSIAMELAHEGKDGHRLGQVNSIRNMATVLGSLFVFFGFKYFNFNFAFTFFLGAIFYFIAGLAFYKMNPGTKNPPHLHLKVHKEYIFYYWLAVLFGTRKQIFLTFAPWVLVTVYGKPTEVIATLLFLGGVTGIFFQPVLGKAIDALGERNILFFEGLLLVFVCLGYGFAKDVFSEYPAFIIVSVCFVMDQLLMSVNMARATYLKKIALSPEHITPTLTMAVSIDHIFSISVAILGGVIWTKLGYQFLFLLGSILAVISFISAWFMKGKLVSSSVPNLTQSANIR